MKKIQTGVLFLLIFALSFALFGCADKPAPEGEPEKALFGTVLSFEGETLALRTARGDFSFAVPDGLEGREGLKKGVKIQLFYRGELPDVTVLRVRAVEGGTTEPDPSGDTEQRTYTGKVVAVSGSSVAIEVSGEVLTFFTSGADLSGVSGGIAEGDTVEILCSGKAGTDAAGLTVQAVRTVSKADGSVPEAPEGPSEPPEPQAPPQETKTVSGIAIDRSLHNLIIQTDGGEMLAFTVTGLSLPDAEYESGTVKVTITYTGSIEGTDTTKATVVSVALA